MTDAPTPREVLARINAVLVVAGLNDTIFSIRDCNSTLFLLLFKKASFSPPQAPSAVEASPMRECYGGACQARRPRPLGGPVHCIRMHPLLLSCRSLLGAGHQPHAPCPSAVALAADEPFPPPPSPPTPSRRQLFTWRLSGVITDPSSTEEHEANYAVLLNAISSDVLEIPLGHISPRALAEGARLPPPPRYTLTSPSPTRGHGHARGA